jgi:hypothetical protein
MHFNVNMLLTDLPKYLYIYLSLYDETSRCGAQYGLGAGDDEVGMVGGSFSGVWWC